MEFTSPSMVWGTSSPIVWRFLQAGSTPGAGTGSDSPGLAEAVARALIGVTVSIIRPILQALVDLLAFFLVNYPDVTKPWVLEVHRTVLLMSIVLGTAAIAWIGINHMLNRVAGIRYTVLVLAAVAVGAAAPTLLQYPVELSRLTTQALLPPDPGLKALASVTLETLLIAVVDVFILLGIAVLFLARNMFLILGVVLAPLIALLVVAPGFRRFGMMFVNIWVACLLIGPLDAVLFHLIMAMLDAHLSFPEYLWTMTGMVMLLGLPLAVLGGGVLVMGPGLQFIRTGSSKVGSRIKDYLDKKWGPDQGDWEEDDWGRDGRYGRRGGRDNRFDWRDR